MATIFYVVNNDFNHVFTWKNNDIKKQKQNKMNWTKINDD